MAGGIMIMNSTTYSNPPPPPPEPPAAPTLISPTNGSKISNTSVTFQWNPSSGATNYQIRVSIDPNVVSPLFHDDTTGGATSKNYTDFPNDGTVYYWKVRAYNAVGWGDWSTIWHFDNGDDDTPVIESGHVGYYDFTPGQTRFWKFVSYVPEGCQYPIQIGNTPQSQEPHTTRLVIKRGSKPTIEDYEWLATLGSSTYDCGDGQYYPPKPPGSEDFFWRFNTGSGGEFVEIFEPMESYTFYIMFYNSGEESVNNQRLTTYYNE
jgi:hypothetical protein